MKDNTVVKKGQAEMPWLIKQYIENYQMSNINRTKTLDELRYPGRENSSCSTRGIRCVKNLVASREIRNEDGIGTTTNGTYP